MADRKEADVICLGEDGKGCGMVVQDHKPHEGENLDYILYSELIEMTTVLVAATTTLDAPCFHKHHPPTHKMFCSASLLFIDKATCIVHSRGKLTDLIMECLQIGVCVCVCSSVTWPAVQKF